MQCSALSYPVSCLTVSFNIENFALHFFTFDSFLLVCFSWMILFISLLVNLIYAFICVIKRKYSHFTVLLWALQISKRRGYREQRVDTDDSGVIWNRSTSYKTYRFIGENRKKKKGKTASNVSIKGERRTRSRKPRKKKKKQRYIPLGSRPRSEVARATKGRNPSSSTGIPCFTSNDSYT